MLTPFAELDRAKMIADYNAALGNARASGQLPPAPPTEGPGTELTKIISWLNLAPKGSCECAARAAQMNAWGPDECERRIDEIVGWLREAHDTLRSEGGTTLPWSQLGAASLVRLAIRRARAIENARQPTGDA